ncbi:hypothetical protein DPMN_003944 [Dreissena polymorpha]|uniref:Uncharacterized protein n=1 Tax=Dreissena polymorpha TaxID=45954 RepID=A0A9D4MRP7_DREPO|nr:hypothetical protein DPMN_003944 [Dreissena polymorpha]
MFLQVTGTAFVAFQSRTTLPSLQAQVGTITSNARSVIHVLQNVDLYWATRVGILQSLNIKANIYVAQGGKIDLPKTVIISKGWWLDVCGTVTSNTQTLTMRDGGELRMSPPASTLEINTVIVDYQGNMGSSKYCTNTTTKVSLSLTYLNSTSDFTLDTTKFTLAKGSTGAVTPTGSALNETYCAINGSLTLLRNQQCTLKAGTTYQFTTLTISPGAKILVEGNASSSLTTTISAADINIMFGGKITGIGAGFVSNGPGSPSASGQGATHAGSGVGNTKSVYGSVSSPITYGSNGFGATTSSGRGGGQIKLSATNTITVDGTIDMSADAAGSGSGGSIWLTAATITGDGFLYANGSGGGAGGRIATVASGSLSFTGISQAPGSKASNGDIGGSGTIQLLLCCYAPPKFLGGAYSRRFVCPSVLSCVRPCTIFVRAISQQLMNGIQ